MVRNGRLPTVAPRPVHARRQPLRRRLRRNIASQGQTLVGCPSSGVGRLQPPNAALGQQARMADACVEPQAGPMAQIARHVGNLATVGFRPTLPAGLHDQTPVIPWWPKRPSFPTARRFSVGDPYAAGCCAGPLAQLRWECGVTWTGDRQRGSPRGLASKLFASAQLGEALRSSMRAWDGAKRRKQWPLPEWGERSEPRAKRRWLARRADGLHLAQRRVRG